MLESILRAAGYREGTYLSPHLLHYNERVRLDGAPVADATLMAAFQRIDEARKTTLTYFEFGTLAAAVTFQQAGVEVAVLEVGMGGRLDAVNIFDADVALVTTVDIDHVQWLGLEREAIGWEKAGIFRPGRPAVCGDPNPPLSLQAHARALATPLACLHQDYAYEITQDTWRWYTPSLSLQDLPRPGLAGVFQYQNAAAVLMVLQLLPQRLQVPPPALQRGLREATLAGRFQVLPGPVERILDVAHNVQAATALADLLSSRPCPGRTLAVLGMLADKDIEGVVQAMRKVVDSWYLGSLQEARGASAEQLAAALERIASGTAAGVFPNIRSAYGAACSRALAGDRVVVFGSFHTVGEVLGAVTEEQVASGTDNITSWG
jgi:dihydrofolate synthase/folylpolyglutamate synthase